jgi:hypothetical protein
MTSVAPPVGPGLQSLRVGPGLRFSAATRLLQILLAQPHAGLDFIQEARSATPEATRPNDVEIGRRLGPRDGDKRANVARERWPADQLAGHESAVKTLDVLRVDQGVFEARRERFALVTRAAVQV